jgi:hypothetical protein
MTLSLGGWPWARSTSPVQACIPCKDRRSPVDGEGSSRISRRRAGLPLTRQTQRVCGHCSAALQPSLTTVSATTSAFHPGLAPEAYPSRIRVWQAAVRKRLTRLLRYDRLHPKENSSPGFRVPLYLSGGATTVEVWRLIRQSATLLTRLRKGLRIQAVQDARVIAGTPGKRW